MDYFELCKYDRNYCTPFFVVIAFDKVHKLSATQFPLPILGVS